MSLFTHSRESEEKGRLPEEDTVEVGGRKVSPYVESRKDLRTTKSFNSTELNNFSVGRVRISYIRVFTLDGPTQNTLPLPLHGPPGEI